MALALSKSLTCSGQLSPAELHHMMINLVGPQWTMIQTIHLMRKLDDDQMGSIGKVELEMFLTGTSAKEVSARHGSEGRSREASFSAV